MSSSFILKNANQLYQEGKIEEALVLYEQIKKEHSHLKNTVEFNIQMCKRQLSAADSQNSKKKLKKGYTVVSAVYGVEKYLNDYFTSLVNQTIGFKEYIHLIMVDDGSLDNSASIIKQWQAKYPENITYLYKENGGQASARNLGIEYVETEWVTFIDPDDFIDKNYFKNIFNYISQNENINFSMLSCNFIVYKEADDTYKDEHPLAYKYKDGNKLVKLKNLNNYIQLAVHSVLFDTNYIFSENIKFPTDVRPNLEDAKFVADYLIGHAEDSNIAFLKDAIYYYRKREDNSSTVDTSWEKSDRFIRVLENACLKMLKEYSVKGAIPRFIKETVLYEISWHLRRVVNHPEKASILSLEEKNKYLALLDKIFSYLDEDFILKFNPKILWFFYKAGILSCFKNKEPSFQIAYLEEIDKIKRQVLIRYFTHSSIVPSIILDGIDVIPDHKKEVVHSFISKRFVKEIRLWIHIPEGIKEIGMDINKKATVISYKGRQSNKISVKEVFGEALTNTNEVDSNTWLLIDRKNQADDNAEHFYRYLTKNHPEKNIYFGLSGESVDWKRLNKESFNLLDISGDKFNEIFKKSGKIISSHIDGELINRFGVDTLKNKDFIFLQHGVTKDDISRWLNSKKINCFITTTSQEYKSIISNEGSYKFSKKEVVFTGFPRYDSLIINNNSSSKVILVMPTWRSYIKNIAIKEKSKVKETDYFKFWLSLLNSESLKNLAKNYGFSIIYRPHPELAAYLGDFKIPEYILKDTNTGIQDLFQKSSFMITDYSSVAFDMAFLGKTVLYYQFDESTFFGGGHTYNKGYYDYREDGFGPVATNEANLLKELELILENDAKPLAKYQARIDKTFCFRDTSNCQRVYEAIIALDAPYEPEKQDATVAMEWAEQAFSNGDWELGYQRFQTMKSRINKT